MPSVVIQRPTMDDDERGPLPMTTQIVETLRSYFAQTFPDRADEIASFSESDSLFEGGFLDSLSFLELVEFVERRYGIVVPPSDFSPERLGALLQIAEYVHARAGSS